VTSIHSLADSEGQPHATVFPNGEPKTIRLTLPGGDAVAPHSHPGRDVVLFLIEGRVSLHLDDETHEVTAGDVTRFRGEREISPQAVERSTALLVLAPRADE
jgi:quercetin dioxygenase-like cupin family protein